MTAAEFACTRSELDDPTWVLSIGELNPELCVVLDMSRVVSTTTMLAQFDRQFPTAVVDTTMFGSRPERLRAALHLAVQHLEPRGRLILTGEERHTSLVDDFDLRRTSKTSGTPEVVEWWRTDRFTVHDLMFEARRIIERVTPIELAGRLASVAPPTVIDTRTHVDRLRYGVISGALHIPRTVVEWHLDPVNGYQHPIVTSFAQPLVVLCNGGYSSSLAAANLHRLGYDSVADLIGGHLAWCAAGLPTEPPDHSHLDL